MMEELGRLLAPLARRITMLVCRGIVTAVDDSNYVQTIQVSLLSGEVRDGIPVVYPYGFTSCPKPGSESVNLFPNGNRANGLAVVVGDRRFRLKGLKGGEVALFTDEGDQIYFQRGNKLAITSQGEVDVTAPTVKIAASTQVTINSPQVTMSGNLTVDGNVTATGALTGASVAATGAIAGATVTAGTLSMATIKTDFDAHTHVAPSGGGTTSGPTPTI